MLEIPFTKLHGAENDFLLTWAADAPAGSDLGKIARRICARTTGIGADGWMLIAPGEQGLSTRLFNSDGSEPEISGNGTRCAAAFALLHGFASAASEIVITTAAGPKTLRLIESTGKSFLFEMDMGLPQVNDLHATLHIAGRDREAAILNVGNPQCVFFVNEFPPDWLVIAREAEHHPRFPQRTNVSFVRGVDRHTLEGRFFERGAGETRSSGTGSTGAAVAAILRKIADSPVEIKTPAGNLNLRWEARILLTGPAEAIGEGRFFLEL
ncbi:MAG: diaminopimelate epimerase [Acidobacteriota bacterium]|nr:diaminopimelate epimerase [Acidobacteriota bacterium]